MNSPQAKLSKLQKFILSEALETYYEHERWAQKQEAQDRRIVPLKDPAGVEVVYNRETLRLHFRLERDPRKWAHLRRKYILEMFYGFWTKETPQEAINRKAIGADAYNSASVSVHRAISRLEVRGLVRRMERSTELQLTAEGIAVAANEILGSLRQHSEEQYERCNNMKAVVVMSTCGRAGTT